MRCTGGQHTSVARCLGCTQNRDKEVRSCKAAMQYKHVNTRLSRPTRHWQEECRRAQHCAAALQCHKRLMTAGGHYPAVDCSCNLPMHMVVLSCVFLEACCQICCSGDVVTGMGHGTFAGSHLIDQGFALHGKKPPLSEVQLPHEH